MLPLRSKAREKDSKADAERWLTGAEPFETKSHPKREIL
jgi:hypothetical protein